ncbi:hypothetical protein [Algoriphagus formosus]|uniref:Uncharacterized protein n=1 Tax=Algoriphagus formosus TaxID=2007308 RepID=A0A4R5V1A4_9BACT|nr:hypothetical protein [Algoriphagus aquimaris]TDK45558.1 hypothetical protein E1898_08670 [Algoriphagus aquimaris]
MKYAPFLLLLFAFYACTTVKPTGTGSSAQAYYQSEPPITQSLFADQSSTISEENIRKILEGTYSLPENLRISLVKLESTQNQRSYYWNNEEYLKSQQEYLDRFTESFKRSERVQQVSQIPDLLISSNPSFTTIREVAVRTQSDLVVIYSINSDLYSHYKVFAKTDMKAFATTQLILMDVRTGLIPFSTIVTEEFQSKRMDGELNDNEAANRIKNEAVLLTIQEIGEQINQFLNQK